MSANNAQRWRNKPCSHDVIDCLTRYRTRPGTVTGPRSRRGWRRRPRLVILEKSEGRGFWRSWDITNTIHRLITIIIPTMKLNVFVEFTNFVLTRFNDGDSATRRRRAEAAAGGLGGGGGSGVVHWASYHPSIKGQNPVSSGSERACGPVKRSSYRDRGVKFYEKENVKIETK